MLTVLIAVAIIILIIAAFRYPSISLALFMTAALLKGILMLKFPIFRVVDYTVLCAILVLIAMAYSFIKSSGRLRDIVSIPLATYLLLAAFLLLGTTYTSAPNYGLEKSSRFATLGLIAFLAPITFAHSLKEVKLMIWIILAAGVLSSIVTLLSPYSAVLRTETRAGFLEADPLITAAQVGIASVIAFVYAIMAHTPAVLRITSLAVIPLTISGIIVTGSRGPVVGLGMTWLLALFICRKGSSKAWLPFIAGAIVIGLVVSFTRLPEIATRRIATIWERGLSEATISRTVPFVWTAKRIPERLIFGHGTGAYAVDTGYEDIRVYPHNILLEALYEQGIVGGIIVVAFLWLIFHRWRLASRLVYLYELDIGLFRTVHIAGLLFLFTFTQAMKSGDLNGNRLMFFCAGLVVAVFTIVRRMVEEAALEHELIPEQQQAFEGYEFQDARILY